MPPLPSDSDAPTILRGNDTTSATSASDRPQAPTALPETIARYRILSLLGEGGMGAVYEAEQDFPHRTVALKVIRAGYATGEMLRRFENETQALGRLQHPGIAQIYDAGAAETPSGRQPWIAMELVSGRSLLVYAREHHLSTHARLELFAKISDAVQHAHQRGLIHRDLKPANILVDGSGQPKILDFGIARLTDADAQATRQTSMGELIGTLAYMSPEQVSGDLHEIDTRSDVYALGVILYELLAGRAPYSIGRQVHEAVQAIRDTEPTALRSVSRAFRGDIETIAGKALEKDKSRRYTSAAEFAADIRRYLRDEPIVARPPSTAYQIQKFARRNKILVSGVAAVFVVLVAGVIVSTREAIVARRAEKQARQQTAIAHAVNNFLQDDLLGQASAYNQSKPDPNITVRTVLDRAAQNIQGKFVGQPEVEAAIRQTIGKTYGDLGLYANEQQQLRQALDLSRRTFGPSDTRTLDLANQLAASIAQSGDPAAAEVMERKVLADDRRIFGDHDRQTLHAMFDLGVTLHLENKFAEAETLLRQTVDLDRQFLGDRDAQTAVAFNNLEGLYLDARENDKAAATGPQALQLCRDVFGPDSPYTLSALENLASADLNTNHLAEAESLYRQAVDIDRRYLGPEHPQTLLAMDNLGGALVFQGNFPQAVVVLTQTVDADRRVLGPQHPQTIDALIDLGGAYDSAGEFIRAHDAFAQVLAASRIPSSPNAGLRDSAMTNVAWADYQLGNYTEAESLNQQLLADDRRHPSSDVADILDISGNLASIELAEGRTAAAETLYRNTLAEMQQKLGSGDRYTLEVDMHLAEAERRLGRFAQETDAALDGLNGRRSLYGSLSTDTLLSQADLALAYLSENKPTEAEPQARAAYEGFTKELPGSWQQSWAQALLGESLAAQHRLADAEPLLHSGAAGLAARKSHIAVPDLYHLRLAQQWLAALPPSLPAAR